MNDMLAIVFGTASERWNDYAASSYIHKYKTESLSVVCRASQLYEVCQIWGQMSLLG